MADVINDADKFQKMINEETPDYADVLVHLYPSARVPLPVLLTLIPPIKPRHYSIASSMNMHPSSVHLLVVLVNWTAKTSGTEKVGQCTRFLSNLHPGATLAVTVRPSVMKLPPLHKQPIIMAGLGTGMAPFRAFIQERAYQRSNGVGVGPMLLYFGSRNRGNEYLYGEELEAYHKEGIITKMGLAFSRDQPQKIYIQHKMGEDKKLLGDLMLGEGPGNEENPPLSSSSSLLHHYIESLPQEKQGVFYLCGPTWPVPDVKEAMVKAFEGKGVDRNNASDLIELLKEEDRYILEVY